MKLPFEMVPFWGVMLIFGGEYVIISFLHIKIHMHISDQIIATSHDLTPKGGLVREIPLFQGNLGW